MFLASGKPVGVSVDWIADNLYWLEEDKISQGKLVVSKGDGRYKRSLVNDITAPTSLAVDPQRGRMFWSSAGMNVSMNSDITVAVDPFVSKNCKLLLKIIKGLIVNKNVFIYLFI